MCLKGKISLWERRRNPEGKRVHVINTSNLQRKFALLGGRRGGGKKRTKLQIFISLEDTFSPSPPPLCE